MSQTFLHLIMRRDLHQDTFKIQFLQEIMSTDNGQRLNFALTEERTEKRTEKRTEERKKIKNYLSSEPW